MLQGFIQALLLTSIFHEGLSFMTMAITQHGSPQGPLEAVGSYGVV